MGIVFNTPSFVTSALTAGGLYLGLEPVKAFMLGAIILYIPIRLLLPFGSKKIFSETGIMASLGTIFAFITLGFALTHAIIFGVMIGYAYLYWWLFFFPRLLK